MTCCGLAIKINSYVPQTERLQISDHRLSISFAVVKWPITFVVMTLFIRYLLKTKSNRILLHSVLLFRVESRLMFPILSCHEIFILKNTVIDNTFFSPGPRFVVQIGDKTIDYNEEFRLFLATRNPSPEIPPDAQSVISEVNFTTTRAGLSSQVSL